MMGQAERKLHLQQESIMGGVEPRGMMGPGRKKASLQQESIRGGAVIRNKLDDGARQKESFITAGEYKGGWSLGT